MARRRGCRTWIVVRTMPPAISALSAVELVALDDEREVGEPRPETHPGTVPIGGR